MKWTTEQDLAIRTTGTNLLVSAAAGSGKTAVLAQRCAYLVCDAPEPCDVDQLLVVTFTNAAANEMRGRIEQALRNRLGDTDDPRLTRQLLLLPRAQIDTLHAFCTHLLRRHFHVLGIDPNFRVLDGEEIALLKHEIARKVLDDRYDAGESEFAQLIDDYADGYDPRILSHMLHLHDLMESVVERDDWLKDAAERLNQARKARPLSDSDMGRELVDLINRWLSERRAQTVALSKVIARTRGLEMYAEYVNELLATIETWRTAFRSGDVEALAREVRNFTKRRLPTIPDPPPEKVAIQDQINRLRKEMLQSTMAAACRFTEREWRDALLLTFPPAKVLVSLVKEFSGRFERAKRDLRGLDFADLERLTLKVLRESDADPGGSSIARLYQRQFKHVLVDEYQDINPVQDAILELLCRGDNLFCVGDVKQSIYRFRLAQPKRFLERYNHFKSKAPAPVPPLPPGEGRGEGVREQRGPSEAPDPLTLTLSQREREVQGRVIDLAANFRSRGPLLGVINGVFKHLMTQAAAEIEYDSSHELKPGATYPTETGDTCFTGAPVELHLLPPPPKDEEDRSGEGDTDLDLDRTEREALFVAHRIRELLDRKMQIAEKSADGMLVTRPLQYRDIVVLLRSMRYKSQPFAAAMRAAGVPVHTDSSTGFFDSTEVRDMLSLLRVLDNQRQDIPLAAFLRSPIAGLDQPEDALAVIRLEYPQLAFHEAVITYAKEKSDELAKKLTALFEKLREWRRIAHQRPVSELVWQIYDETGYLAFCSGMEDGSQRSANLIEFHERATQFGTFQRQGLGRFMQFLNTLADQSDLGQPSIASEADDVVRIMTIHRAKGLEFPVVIVPDLGKQHNLLDARGAVLIDRDAGIGLMAVDQKRRVRYPTLSHLLVQDRIKRQTLAEEMRVLYVAMTRAREHLILVGTCKEDQCQQWRDQWSGHVGPLPLESVLSGRTMLDWLGPAASVLAGEKPEPIRLCTHEEQEIQAWSIAADRRPSVSEDRLPLARLRPLQPAPAMPPDAARLIERLTRAYPHQPFTAIAASTSVGSLTKEGRLAPGGQSPSRQPILPIDRELRPPRFATAESIPLATEIGTATHLVLEHLDFSRKCDRDDLSLQITDLVRRKLLPEPLAKVVDIDAILWFISTPIGQLLRRNNDRLHRELPIYSPLPALPPTDAPASTDPMDRVMLRGRLDLLVADQSGFVIVDYKTDAVTDQTVDARAQFYRAQVQTYRDAIRRATGRPVSKAVLVFLSPRIIKEL